jgi:hypothetical protein
LFFCHNFGSIQLFFNLFFALVLCYQHANLMEEKFQKNHKVIIFNFFWFQQPGRRAPSAWSLWFLSPPICKILIVWTQFILRKAYFSCEMILVKAKITDSWSLIPHHNFTKFQLCMYYPGRKIAPQTDDIIISLI